MKTDLYFNEGTPFESMKPLLRVGGVMPSCSVKKYNVIYADPPWKIKAPVNELST